MNHTNPKEKNNNSNVDNNFTLELKMQKKNEEIYVDITDKVKDFFTNNPDDFIRTLVALRFKYNDCSTEFPLTISHHLIREDMLRWLDDTKRRRSVK